MVSCDDAFNIQACVNPGHYLCEVYPHVKALVQKSSPYIEMVSEGVFTLSRPDKKRFDIYNIAEVFDCEMCGEQLVRGVLREDDLNADLFEVPATDADG